MQLVLRKKNKILVPKFNQRILEELKKLIIKNNVIEETKAIQPEQNDSMEEYVRFLSNERKY